MIKVFRETGSICLTEQSIEQKAINNLKALLKLEDIDEILRHKDFIRALLEDILDYGTLPDYTLRRIANINIDKEESILSEIEGLKQQLGEDYLYREKERLKDMVKEIIIAVEDRMRH